MTADPPTDPDCPESIANHLGIDTVEPGSYADAENSHVVLAVFEQGAIGFEAPGDTPDAATQSEQSTSVMDSLTSEMPDSHGVLINASASVDHPTVQTVDRVYSDIPVVDTLKAWNEQ